MTTQDRFIDHGTLPTGIPRVLHQFMLGLYTAMPGEIVAYDAATRRADVRGALAIMVKDDAGQEEPIDRPVISNVPVLLPSSGFMGRMGGFLLSFPLKAGDPVQLLFSMRGLAQWKLTNGRLEVGDKAPIPDVDSLLSERDAIAIPGFGPEADNLPPEGWPSVAITAGDDSLTMIVGQRPCRRYGCHQAPHDRNGRYANQVDVWRLTDCGCSRILRMAAKWGHYDGQGGRPSCTRRGVHIV